MPGGRDGIKANPVGMNRYAYSANDPINKSDKNGHADADETKVDGKTGQDKGGSGEGAENARINELTLRYDRKLLSFGNVRPGENPLSAERWQELYSDSLFPVLLAGGGQLAVDSRREFLPRSEKSLQAEQPPLRRQVRK